MATNPPKAPTDRQPKAHVLEARKSRAMREVLEARAAEANAKRAELLAANPNHPDDEDKAVSARAKAASLKKSAKELLSGVGLTESDAVRLLKSDHNRIEALEGQIDEWKQKRDIHQDFVDNPDLYGGTDMGGTPLNAEANIRAVAELDAGIAAAQAELDSLRS